VERYFFHIDYGEFSRDSEGTSLPNLRAARGAAVQLLGEILRDAGDEFWAKPDLIVTVTDSTDLTLWTLPVSGDDAPSVSRNRALSG